MEKSEGKNVHSNFQSIINDFVSDLNTTFPDYSHLWENINNTDENVEKTFNYCVKVFPERFFDILYQNEEIFSVENTTNTFFLPNVDFKVLFSCDNISEKTKKFMWKYLQLILFTVVGEIKDKNNFGDTLNMFDGIDENELQGKLKETMESITEFFHSVIKEEKLDETNEAQEDDEEPAAGGGASFKEEFKNMFENMPSGEEFKKSFPFGGGFPNMSNIQEHLKTLFEGKIGSIAREMAEEISGEFGDILGEDVKDIHSTRDVIQKLMKDPKKIMDLMKTVGNKLDSKMKSGEISKDEIMKEAGDLFGKMKDMGGQEQFTEMFKNLAKGMGGLGGLGGLGKNMKLDQNAIDRMEKMKAQKDRMRRKAEQKKVAEELARRQLELQIEQQKQAAAEARTKYSLDSTDNLNNFVFRLEGEDAQEKSFIHPDILKEILEEDNKKMGISKETKNKKKKNKKNK